MKKNGPGCTCCAANIFTQGDAELVALSDGHHGHLIGGGRDLPKWARDISTLVRSGELPPGSPTVGGGVWDTMPGGVVLTPEGWLYFVTKKAGVEGIEGRFQYVILPIDIASTEYVATQTNQPPAVILQNNNHWTDASVKVVAKTPGRDAGGADDVVVHITSLASVGGLDTSDWTTTDMPQWLPIQFTDPWYGWLHTEAYWNPEYIAWQRTGAEQQEPAHGVEVYSPSGELVQEYSVPGASHRLVGIEPGQNFVPFGSDREVHSASIAPTGESVYWLADATLVRWWTTETFDDYWSWGGPYLLEGEEYGNLVEPSAFPFADLVQDEDVLEAAGAPKLDDRFWEGDYQYFQFLIHNSEPLALLPIITGSIEYIARQYHYGAVWTYDEDGQPIIPFTETRDTKRAKFILENACLTYSHAISAPVLVGNYGNSVVQSGGVTRAQNNGHMNLDEITLDDPGIAGKIIVYKYDGGWVEVARIETGGVGNGRTKSICEGVDSAIYILGNKHPSSTEYNVYRLDPEGGQVTTMSGTHNSGVNDGDDTRNWFGLPTNPFHDFGEREAQNPPPTVAG